MKKKEKGKYCLILLWSEEDQCFLATCPEFRGLVNMRGPIAHGSSWGEAADEATTALEGIIEVLEEGETPLPDPIIINNSEDIVKLLDGMEEELCRLDSES